VLFRPENETEQKLVQSYVVLTGKERYGYDGEFQLLLERLFGEEEII